MSGGRQYRDAAVTETLRMRKWRKGPPESMPV